MTSLSDRPSTALLVIDVQNDVVATAHNRDAVIANIATLVGGADSFEATDLEAVLAEHKVGRLIVTGAQTDACIRSTLHGAIVRGYDATLVSDAHTTQDHSQWGAPTPDKVIAHTNLYWQYETAPGRSAGTVPTDSVDFGETPV